MFVNTSLSPLNLHTGMRLSWLVILSSLCLTLTPLTSSKITGYHNYTAVMDRLRTLEEDNPGLVNLYSIGQSVEERNLTVIQLTRQKVFQQMENAL